MALNVYLTRNEIPRNLKVVDVNDSFFDSFTQLGTSKFEHDVLNSIDCAERVSDKIFLGRTEYLGGLYKNNLSTGTKTLLNIYNFPNDYCFNVVECGTNALEFLCDLKNGHVLLEYPLFTFDRDNEECDILCKGKHFKNIIDFFEFDWEV